MKLNNFLIAGLIFRRNFTKTTIKIKKNFYFFEKKLEFLKNQTLYLKQFQRLKTPNRLDFTTFLYLRQNILLTTSLGFLSKTNLSLEFLVIKMINGLTFHNLFLDYQKSIQNQFLIIKLKDFFLIENDLVKGLNFKQSICYINQYRQCLIKFRLKSKKVKDKKIIKKIQTIRAFYKKKLEVLKTINFSRLNTFLNVIKEQFKRKTRLALKNRKSLLKNQKLLLKKNLKKNS